MGYLSIDNHIPSHFGKHAGKAVSYLIQVDAQYLIWLHNSDATLFLGRSVLMKLGLWERYKNTKPCKDYRCLAK